MLIGVDPGKNGGIAALSHDGEVHLAAKMPPTHRDLWNLIKPYGGELNFCYLEKVHSMPGQGVKSTFTFGEGFGALQMALTAAGIPFELVTPNKWQKAMGCQTKGDKNVSKAAAQRLFPNIKITHAIADALLIAEYGRRLRT